MYLIVFCRHGFDIRAMEVIQQLYPYVISEVGEEGGVLLVLGEIRVHDGEGVVVQALGYVYLEILRARQFGHGIAYQILILRGIAYRLDPDPMECGCHAYGWKNCNFILCAGLEQKVYIERSYPRYHRSHSLARFERPADNRKVLSSNLSGTTHFFFIDFLITLHFET